MFFTTKLLETVAECMLNKIIKCIGIWPIFWQPGWAGTKRNIHPLTPILIINHPLSASAICCDPWHPFSSVHMPDSLFAQCLTKFSMVYLLVWHPPLHTPYISSPNHVFSFRNTCPYHRNLFCCSPEILSFNTSLSLSQLYFSTTFPSEHSHLCPLKCHLIFFSYRPGLTSMQHATSHTTAVQFPSHHQWYILIGKQWYQMPEFIPSNSNCGIHSCISISSAGRWKTHSHMTRQTSHCCRPVTAADYDATLISNLRTTDIRLSYSEIARCQQRMHDAVVGINPVLRSTCTTDGRSCTSVGVVRTDERTLLLSWLMTTTHLSPATSLYDVDRVMRVVCVVIFLFTASVICIHLIIGYYVALVVVLWRPALLSSSSAASVTALR